MKKYTTILLAFLILCTYNLVHGQLTTIDTIPFNFDKLLLVFNGKINNQPVSFAFDTGASITVSNSAVDEEVGITKKAGSLKARDANRNVIKTKKVKMETLQIGSQVFNDLKCITSDMPLLYCSNLVLLGQDIIKKLHWKIDFDKQLLYVSKTAFAVSNTSVTWPVTYKGNRPHIPIQVNDEATTNCLIDFGYTGILDINESYTGTKSLLQKKQENGKVNEYYAASMGLAGLGTSQKQYRFLADSIYIEKMPFKNVYTSISVNANTKIGLLFFKNYCSTIILDFKENNFYLETKKNTNALPTPLDANITIKDDKFIVTDVNLNKNSSAAGLEIGETIKSIDGKLCSDYTTECEFVLWKYLRKKDSLRLEKMDGTILTVTRSSNF